MKKIISITLILVIIVSFIPLTASASEEWPIYITIQRYHSRNLLRTDVVPQIINGRTMVPMRVIFEALGLYVEWDGETQTVTGTRPGSIIELTIGNETAIVNGESVTLDQPALIIDGSTMVPVRFIGESLGAEVTWYEGLRYRVVRIDDSVFHIYQYEQQRQQAFEQHMENFNMNIQYISDNFYWWSIEENAQWLPEMAIELESRLPEIFNTFGFEGFPNRKNAMYWSIPDFSRNYNIPINQIGYWGFGYQYGFSVVRPHGSTYVTNIMIDYLVHETVHTIQHMIPIINRFLIPRWIIEGTAAYFETYFYEYNYGNIMRNRIRTNRIPTLAQLENSDYFWGRGRYSRNSANENYGWSATIIEFIHITFGFEYVVELHINPNIPEVFGISRVEFERQWHQYLRDNF